MLIRLNIYFQIFFDYFCTLYIIIMKVFLCVMCITLTLVSCDMREPIPPYTEDIRPERMHTVGSDQTNIEESFITSNRVNMREKPEISSKIITQLNENDRVIVLEQLKEQISIGASYGTWVKVELHDGRVGYVYSSFVNSINTKVQSFHEFFRDFKINWQEHNDQYLLNYIDFPLLFRVFEGRQMHTNRVSSIDELYEHIVIDENPMQDFLFTAKIGNKYEVDYSYTGFSYTLHFRLVDKKWKLEKVFKSIM